MGLRSRFLAGIAAVVLAGCAALAGNQISTSSTSAGKSGDPSPSPNPSPSSTVTTAATPTSFSTSAADLPDLPPGVTPLVSAQMGSYQIGPLDGSGNLYYTNGNGFGRVPTAGGSPGQFWGYGGVSFGPVDGSGNLHFLSGLGTDSGFGQLDLLSPFGEPITVAAAPSTAQLSNGSILYGFFCPCYLAPDGNLILGENIESYAPGVSSTNALVNLAPSGLLTTMVASGVESVGPVDPQGNAYFTTVLNHELARVSSAGVMSVLATGSGPFYLGPMDSSGNLFFSSGYYSYAASASIGVVTPGAHVTSVAVGVSGIRGFSSNAGRDGAYWNDLAGIFGLSSSGQLTTLVSTSSALVLGPVDTAGDLYFVSSSALQSSVDRMTPTGQVSTVVAAYGGTFGLGPIDQSGNLYVSYTANGIDPWVGKVAVSP